MNTIFRSLSVASFILIGYRISILLKAGCDDEATGMVIFLVLVPFLLWQVPSWLEDQKVKRHDKKVARLEKAAERINEKLGGM